MSVHLTRQIERLKHLVLTLGNLVEDAVAGAIRALEQRDAELAQKIIQSDEKIDELEIDVEEECLHTLALHQPVAHDLRYVVAVLKINNDLERIADQAVNIAEQAVALAAEPALDIVPFDLAGEAAGARLMLKQALDSFVRMDVELAERVRAEDDTVDRIHAAMYDAVKSAIRRSPDKVDQLIRFLSVSRNLERVADLATNIAEDVIYMGRGEILRHQPPDHRTGPK